jgi:hypothetical protein
VSREKRILVVRREHAAAAVKQLAREGWTEATQTLTDSGSVLIRAKQAKAEVRK